MDGEDFDVAVTVFLEALPPPPPLLEEGMVSLAPAMIRLTFLMPLAAAIALTEVPFLAAMEESVSPDLIVYELPAPPLPPLDEVMLGLIGLEVAVLLLVFVLELFA